MSRQIRIASLIWGASLLLSRVIGLVREAVFGRVLGTSEQADVYLAAFPFADFLNYLLAAGALSIVFIPIFGGYLARGEEDQGWQAFSVISTFIATLILAATAAMWVAAPWLVPQVVPGFTGEAGELLVRIVRIIVPAQIFHVLGGLLSATLQARDRHTLPALAPLIYTAGIIVGGLALGTAEGFAWGVLAGSALGPFLLPLIGCARAGMRFSPTLNWRHPDLKRYLWLSLPIMLGLSIVVVDDWIITWYASTMEEGTLAVLRYAKNLMRVPMGVFGLATGVAAYPTISRMVGRGEHGAAFETLSGAVRAMLVLAFGAQVVFTVAGAEISQVLYGARIPAEDHQLIGQALAILCVGLWAWAAQTVVARGFYARGETWVPTLAGTGAALLTFPLYGVLAAELGPLGLPIATTLAITLYVLALVLLLRKRHPGHADGYGAFALRVVPVAALSIGVGVALDRALALPHPLLQGGVTGGLSGLLYLGGVLALRVPEARLVLDKIVGRLRRRRGGGG